MALETSVTHVDDLNVNWPDGSTDSRRKGDDHIRNIKVALKTTLAVEHDIATGKHTAISLPEQGSAPTNVAAFGYLYTKEVNSLSELFFMDDAGTETQITSGGVAGDSFTPIEAVADITDSSLVSGTVETGTLTSAVASSLALVSVNLYIPGTTDDESRVSIREIGDTAYSEVIRRNARNSAYGEEESAVQALIQLDASKQFQYKADFSSASSETVTFTTLGYFS